MVWASSIRAARVSACPPPAARCAKKRPHSASLLTSIAAVNRACLVGNLRKIVATPTWQRSATSSTVALIPLPKNTARAAAKTSSSVMPWGRAITESILRNPQQVNSGHRLTPHEPAYFPTRRLLVLPAAAEAVTGLCCLGEPVGYHLTQQRMERDPAWLGTTFEA